MTGFILLHREIKDWEWYCSPNVMRVYIHLIIRVNYLDKKWQGVLVKRGQLITSNKHLAEELSLSIQQIRTALSKLKKSGYITCKATKRFTLVTVTGYNARQSSNISTNKQKNILATNGKHTNNNQLTTTKQSNNKNNLKKETIECRKEKFKKEVFAHTQFSRQILNSFFNHWSEENDESNMRFENQEFWNLKGRLEKWKKTEKNFIQNKDKGNFSPNR